MLNSIVNPKILSSSIKIAANKLRSQRLATNHHMNEPSVPNTVRKLLYLPAKCLALVASTLGSIVIVVAPFAVKVSDALGFIGSLLVSISVVVLAVFIGNSCQNFVVKETKENPARSLLPVVVYMPAVALQIAAVVSALRIVAWASARYLNLDIDWLYLPTQ